MDGEQGRIFELGRERDRLVRTVVEREFARKTATPGLLELILNDAAFFEIARLEDSGSSELARWRALYRRLGRMDEEQRRAELRGLLERYAGDVVGNFRPEVYRFATRVVPVGLSGLMRPQLNLDRMLNLSTMRERIRVQGEVPLVRELARRGTVILAPSHQSNLDSIVIGWSLFSNDLPPFTYGAGKNLFFNPLISFFMHNLGAYKVDRRLKFTLYKDVLKAYSQVLLEEGYHSLFFPGGTRSRSGAVENKLKLGLLGTGIAAAIAQPRRPIFVVPCTLNYHLVLEAETLIDDYLKEQGKSRYIIEDDESSRLSRVIDYARKSLALDASMVIHYGDPVDLWGNRVDEQGVSYDDRGRPVDTRRYLMVGDRLEASAQRDAEYVTALGERLSAAFHRYSVALSTHLVAYALFSYLRRLRPEVDLYAFVRIPPADPLSSETVFQEVEQVRNALLRLADRGRILLGSQVRKGPVEAIVAGALRHFGMYHQRPVIVREGDKIRINDMKLLLYYHNRLTGFDLERLLGKDLVASVPASTSPLGSASAPLDLAALSDGGRFGRATGGFAAGEPGASSSVTTGGLG